MVVIPNGQISRSVVYLVEEDSRAEHELAPIPCRVVAGKTVNISDQAWRHRSVAHALAVLKRFILTKGGNISKI